MGMTGAHGWGAWILVIGVLCGVAGFCKDARAADTRPDWPAYHVAALPDEGVGLPYDANGCIYWKGQYHLMYIFQDPKLPKGGHCWGHLSSPDLIHWTYLPTALAPNPGDVDTGIFSGNAFVNKDGVPMLCWFGIDAGVCVATAEDDDLIHWKKHPKNPIIPMPKPGEPGDGVYRVWDPFLWLQGDTYYCLLGGNTLPNKKDTLYLCKSPDMVNWKPLFPFYEHPDLSWTGEGEDCSCPDFFKLGDKWVLLCISHKVGGRCYVGRYENEKFLPEQHVRMNWPGGQFFAPESLLDAQGRRVFWAWVTDPRMRPSQDKTGSGYQSLPRILSLDKDGTVRITPAPELEALRTHPRQLEPMTVAADTEKVLDGVSGDCFELALDVEPGDAKAVGLKVRCAPDGSEETAVWYDPVAKVLRVDVTKSTLRKDVAYGDTVFVGYNTKKEEDIKNRVNTFEAPFSLPAGEPLKLRVFLDKSMLEVFANDRQCVTQVIYPERKDSLLVKACAKGAPITVRSTKAWDMEPLVFKDERGKH